MANARKYDLGCLPVGCSDLKLLGFDSRYDIGPKSLTSWRGPEVNRGSLDQELRSFQWHLEKRSSCVCVCMQIYIYIYIFYMYVNMHIDMYTYIGPIIFFDPPFF